MMFNFIGVRDFGYSYDVNISLVILVHYVIVTPAPGVILYGTFPANELVVFVIDDPSLN